MQIFYLGTQSQGAGLREKGSEAGSEGEPGERCVIQLAPALSDCWLDPVGPSKKPCEMCLRTICLRWHQSISSHFHGLWVAP